MTTTNTWTDDDEVDPRLAAISEALQNEQDKWVTIENGEVIFDTLVAAAIAAVATDELVDQGVPYCNPQCHADEYNYYTEFIRAFSEDCNDSDYPCSDKMLEALAQTESRSLTTPSEDNP